mmetsp:Transcript_120224/g.256572  ORF Transcript_120224/g.256572 Transcript_120224/m.256572 type:complete len:243 (+) Transcript_120224:113-841(+)
MFLLASACRPTSRNAPIYFIPAGRSSSTYQTGVTPQLWPTTSGTTLYTKNASPPGGAQAAPASPRRWAKAERLLSRLRQRSAAFPGFTHSGDAAIDLVDLRMRGAEGLLQLLQALRQRGLVRLARLRLIGQPGMGTSGSIQFHLVLRGVVAKYTLEVVDTLVQGGVARVPSLPLLRKQVTDGALMRLQLPGMLVSRVAHQALKMQQALLDGGMMAVNVLTRELEQLAMMHLRLARQLGVGAP